MLPKFDPIGISLTALLLALYAPRAARTLDWQHWVALGGAGLLTALLCIVERSNGVSILPFALWGVLGLALTWWAVGPLDRLHWFPTVPLAPFVSAIMAAFLAVDVYASATLGLIVGGARWKDGLVLTPLILLPLGFLASYLIDLTRDRSRVGKSFVSRADDFRYERQRVSRLFRYNFCIDPRRSPNPGAC